MKNTIYSLLVVFTLFLTGCTDADAGKDQTVNEGVTVTLDGNASAPSHGGEITQYKWKQIRHRNTPRVQLSDVNSVYPTFVAPDVNVSTKLTFRLKTVEVKGSRRYRSYDNVCITVLPVTDTTAPVITLIGEANVIHYMYPDGDNLYVDSGASATDNIDGNITSNIVTDMGNLDLYQEGNYTITYNVSDAAGNEASEVIRIVSVIDNTPIDTTPPVIELIGEANMILNLGDTYTEFGAIVTDDTDDNINADINGTVDTAIAGIYTIIYTAKDQAGNEATPLTRTVTVNALQNIVPTAVITADRPMFIDELGPNLMELVVGDTVNFSAEDSTDEDGQIVSYSWEDDVENVVSEESNFTHTFTQSGNFGIKLLVIDNDGAHGQKTVQVTVIDNNETNASGQTLSGRVTDVNGTAIAGAIVTIGEKSTLTDTNGSYSIDGIEASNRVSIDVVHPDYLANSRIVVVGDEDVTLDIKLGAPKATLTFAATTGATVSHDNASVELPSGGYIDANGTAYIGDVTVKMSYYPITTQSGRATFPGTFEGIDDNGTFPIQSYGFMNVELTDPQGNALNLDGNSTATLTYPRDNSIYPQPTTIPLWYYDTEQGYWVQEGEAVQVGSTYVGTVTHFTSWNLDAKGPRAKFTGCVEDPSGNKVPNALVQFSSINWDSYSVPTDENGSISVINILAQTSLNFGAYSVINNSIYYGDKTIYLSEGEDRVDNSCVVLSQQGNLPDTITLHGVYLDFTSHENEDIYLAPRGTANILGQTKIDATGGFTIVFKPSDSLEYTVGQGFDGPLYGSNFQIRPNKNVYSITIDRRPQ